jgi:hypothetical protein
LDGDHPARLCCHDRVEEAATSQRLRLPRRHEHRRLRGRPPVSLELGGAPDDAANLWPEPYTTTDGARVKDVVENKLNSLVCAGSITLIVAQHAIATNWWIAYQTYVGTPPAPATTAALPPPAPAPAPATPPPPEPAAQSYPNCAALNIDYPHGVGKSGAVDHVSSGTPVTNFTVNDAVYQANTARDGDKDGIACEKH